MRTALYLSLAFLLCLFFSLHHSLSVVHLLSRLRWSECVMFLLFTVRSTALKTLMGSWCGTWTSTPTSSITWPAAAMTVKSSSGTCVTSTSLSSVWRSTLTGQTEIHSKSENEHLHYQSNTERCNNNVFERCIFCLFFHQKYSKNIKDKVIYFYTLK